MYVCMRIPVYLPRQDFATIKIVAFWNKIGGAYCGRPHGRPYRYPAHQCESRHERGLQFQLNVLNLAPANVTTS